MGIPEALQAVTELRAGNAHADVPRSDSLDRVRFVKDNKIVLEQHAALPSSSAPPNCVKNSVWFSTSTSDASIWLRAR